MIVNQPLTNAIWNRTWHKQKNQWYYKFEDVFQIYLNDMKKKLSFYATGLLFGLILFTYSCAQLDSPKQANPKAPVTEKNNPSKNRIDTAKYDSLIRSLANADTTGKWPAKIVYPLPGAILPYNRVVAYYGNLYSKKMGILGELPKSQMLAKLKGEVAKWQAADPTIPVIPALHYVATTAQGTPQKDSMYRYRMPFHQIDTILSWTNQIKGIAFLDVQVAHSTVGVEVPTLEKYLKTVQCSLRDRS